MIPPLPAIMVEPSVRAALLEDLGRAGDLTTDAIVPASARTECALIGRQPGVVAGLDFSAAAFRLIDPAIEMIVERVSGPVSFVVNKPRPFRPDAAADVVVRNAGGRPDGGAKIERVGEGCQAR